jgi:hypothetical protein
MDSFINFFKYIIFHHVLLYCDMSSEIIQCVAFNNYDDFQNVDFIFLHKDIVFRFIIEYSSLWDFGP